MKKYSGLRATLGAVVVGLVCTSCSALSAFSTGTKPTVQPAPTEAAAPAASASASTVPVTVNARHRRQVRQRFLAGVNGYCRAFYLGERAANVRYPSAAGDPRASLLMARDVRRLVGRLEALRAPSSEDATEFHGFVRNERDLVGPLLQTASSDPAKVSAGDAAYNQVLGDRHEYASILGAKECDGRLPHAQERAAAAATRRWDVTASAHESCVSLVTPQFSVSTWGATGHPLATCVQEFHSRRANPLGPQRAIRVQSVTGVENLQATVTFIQVPDCGCGPLQAKLYFEGGRWLLNGLFRQ